MQGGENTADSVWAVRSSEPGRTGQGKPETFSFLGFTHYCGKRRSNGTFQRLAENGEEADGSEATDIKAELRRRMHEPIALVGGWLKKVVVGYFEYHAFLAT